MTKNSNARKMTQNPETARQKIMQIGPAAFWGDEYDKLDLADIMASTVSHMDNKLTTLSGFMTTSVALDDSYAEVRYDVGHELGKVAILRRTIVYETFGEEKLRADDVVFGPSVPSVIARDLCALLNKHANHKQVPVVSQMMKRIISSVGVSQEQVSAALDVLIATEDSMWVALDAAVQKCIRYDPDSQYLVAYKALIQNALDNPSIMANILGEMGLDADDFRKPQELLAHLLYPDAEMLNVQWEAIAMTDEDAKQYDAHYNGYRTMLEWVRQPFGYQERAN